MEPRRDRRSLPALARGRRARSTMAVYAAVARRRRRARPGHEQALRGRGPLQAQVTVAGVLAVAGGSRGRRAARDGLASSGCTRRSSTSLIKPLGRRGRPDRAGQRGPGRPPRARCPPRPRSRPATPPRRSRSPPASGHVLPQAAVPLRGSPPSSPTRACTRGSTTRATSSSGRCWGRRWPRPPHTSWSAPRRRRHRCERPSPPAGGQR